MIFMKDQICTRSKCNTSNEQQFRLKKINEIKDSFIAGIKERELIRQRLSKYIVSFDHFDKSLIVSSLTT